MLKLPIMSCKKMCGDAESNGVLVAGRPLPVAYMSEYSVMGFLVEDWPGAMEALVGRDFSIADDGPLPELVLDDLTHVDAVLAFLFECGIRSEFGDLVSGVYQG